MIIAVIVIVIIVLGVSIYTYWQQTMAPVRETITVTEAITRTITQTILSTVTVRETTTIPAVQPTITTTVTVTITTPPTTQKPPSPALSNVSTGYTSSGIVEALTWTRSAPMDLDGAYGSGMFLVPKDTNISDIASKLNEYLKDSFKKLPLTNTFVSVPLAQDNDLGIVLMLHRGNPCVQYRVEILDGDPSDRVIRIKVEKYSTAPYCIQVVPTDNQYVALLVIRNPGLQDFRVEIMYSDGVRTSIVELHVTQQ